VETAPRGHIYSWERAWHPVHPALKDHGPFIRRPGGVARRGLRPHGRQLLGDHPGGPDRRAGGSGLQPHDDATPRSRSCRVRRITHDPTPTAPPTSSSTSPTAGVSTRPVTGVAPHRAAGRSPEVTSWSRRTATQRAHDLWASASTSGIAARAEGDHRRERGEVAMSEGHRPDRLRHRRLEGEDGCASGWGPIRSSGCATVDRDGIDAEVIFPTRGSRCGPLPIRSSRWPQCRVYNDWAHRDLRSLPRRKAPAAALATGDRRARSRRWRARPSGGSGCFGRLPWQARSGAAMIVDHPNYNLRCSTPCGR